MSVAVGALFVVASFYKQVAVAPAVVIAIAHVLWPPEGVTRRGAIAQGLVIGLTGMLAWAALFGYFALTGRAWLFAQTMFVHPRWYQGDVIANLAASLAPANLFGPDVRSLLPLALAALLALLPRSAGAPRRPGRLLAAAAVGTHLAVAWPGQFHDHYYQLWLPVLCVAAGWGVVRLGSLSRMPNRWLARALGAVLAAALLWPQVSWFTLSPDARAERKHGGMFARALRDGREVASLMLPGETLYTWSDEAWLYHVARRRVPAAGLWKSHTLEGPLAQWLARRTVEDLERNPPDFFVDWATIDSPADHPIRHWFETRYTPLVDGKTRWPFVVYVRDGSDAQRRLSRRP